MKVLQLKKYWKFVDTNGTSPWIVVPLEKTTYKLRVSVVDRREV